MATTFNLNIDKTLLAANESTTFTLTFDQRVIGLTERSFAQRGVTLSDLTTTDGVTFTGTITANDSFNGLPILYARAGSYRNGEDFSPGSVVGFNALKIDSTQPLAPEVTLPNPGPDGVYNKDEVNDNGTVTATITLPKSDNEFETTKPGDVLIVNDEEITITQDMIDNGYEVEVEPGTEPTDITVSIRDKAGNVGDATTQQLPAADLIAPTAPTITLDSTGEDDVYNSQEVNPNGTVNATITVPSDVQVGDTLTVDGVDYPVTQDVLDNGLSVEVTPGAEVTAAVTDAAGNVGTSTVIQVPAADLEAPSKPIVTFTQDKDDDGVINTDELNGNDNVEYTVAIGDDVQVGDTLIVNGTEITVTDAIKQAGAYTGTLPAIDGESVEVVAQLIDQAGNPSEVSTDTATLNLTIPDADPIYLWHLGANLSNIEGPSDVRGKFGGKYGDEINYETGNLNDAIYIGYTGRDAHGNLIVSKWDGDFERDAEDGHALWTMETYAGNDLVYIREDQNAYTSTKLGTGDDTYYAQGKLDANFGAAQYDQNARAYVYTETGNDTVVIGGNGEGKVTGWGIEGGRIFTGSGSDNVTVYGDMVNGGVIDLGAGRTEYAPDDQAASTVDQKGDINNVTITHNLGTASDKYYGRIFGGAGDDNVSIGTFVEGRSEINLGEGTNSVTIGDDLDGHSKVITGSGDDTLTIGDDTEDYSSIDLGDGNNVINVHDALEDRSSIVTGEGNDTLTVGGSTWNQASVDLGAGDDTVTIAGSMYHSSNVNLGTGDDSMTVNGMHHDSQINAGEGDDIITFTGEKMNGSINGGSGDDTLVLDFTENNSLVSKYTHETNVSTKDISGFETIELNGKNALDVRFEDLLQDSDRDGALFIKGTSDSKVDLGSTNWNSDAAWKAQWKDATGGTWGKADTTTVDGVTYDVYHNSKATDQMNDVYIEQGIVVI